MQDQISSPVKFLTVHSSYSTMNIDWASVAREFSSEWENATQPSSALPLFGNAKPAPPASAPVPTLPRKSRRRNPEKGGLTRSEIQRLGRRLEAALRDDKPPGLSMPYLEGAPEVPFVPRAPRRRGSGASTARRPLEILPWIRHPTRPVPVHRHLPRVPTVSNRWDAEAEMVALCLGNSGGPRTKIWLAAYPGRRRLRARDGSFHRVSALRSHLK